MFAYYKKDLCLRIIRDILDLIEANRNGDAQLIFLITPINNHVRTFDQL